MSLDPMRILIADDESLARERLVSLIHELDAGEVVAQCTNGMETIMAVGGQRPDVVLLDIRMPGMDGLEVASHLTALPKPPAIVFVTAYGDHALEAFERAAVDYLLKPVARERLEKALARVASITQPKVQAVQRQVTSPLGRTHFSAVQQGNLRLVAIREVRYLLADNKYVTAGWPGGQLLLEESLKSIEAEFPERFLRVHRNALVALSYVTSLEKGENGEFAVGLSGVPERMAVSRRHLPGVRDSLRQLRLAETGPLRGR
jgi:two-component system response regulator AlgR